MAITTDSYFDIVYDEETLDRIGLSKTLDNYSISEIADYSYVGSYSYYGKQMMSKSLSGYTYVGFSQLNGSCPFAANFHSGTYETIDIEDGQTENYNLTENGLYRRVILLNAVNGQYDDVINNISNYKIITEFDAPKYTIDMGNKSSMLFESTPYWYYDSVGGTTRYNTHLGANDNVQIATCGFAAYVIIPFNSTYYILRASLFSRIFEAYSINNSYQAHCSDVFTDYTGNNPAAIAETVVQWFKNYDFTNDDSTPIVHPLNTSIDYWSPYDGYCSLLRFEGAAMGFYQYFMFTDETKLMTFLAGMYGLHFIVDGTVYKPIITDNFVLGYSDDLTVTSDLDNYIGSTKHDLPVTPPAPPTPSGDDESDDQESGGIYTGAQGMCNLYYMTASEIKNLQNWFRGTVFAPGIQIPGNFDPSDQLIGLMAFPIELGGSVDSTTITFRTADNQSVDTGVSCQKAYGDDLKFDMGTIDIPARMAQRGVPFLDYSCQVEVYIPFCNVVQLDVQQVIGTTLKCEMWISPATGDVSAMLSSGTHPVAYTSGNCAQQLPISVSSYGAIAGAKMAADNKMTQAVFQAAQNVVKDITTAGAITSAVSSHTAVNGQGLVEFSRIPQVQSNTGLAVGAGVKAAGSMVNTALNLTAQNFDNRYALSVAKNSAPTHVSGSFGSCTSWHFPNYCYVKITRPHFKKPDNYGHTEAVPVVATKRLSSLSGLTTCVNPDVSGIGTATMQELETIKSYLMSGVIL